MMASSDPSICLVHPGKRQAIGVCHLCLRDRLMRLSLSGESSSSHNTLLPSCSSRSSFDSSCSKTDDSSGLYNSLSNNKSSGKLGTIFSLIESDSEEPPRESDESLPEILPKSRSVKQPPGKASHGSTHSPLISAPPTPPGAHQQDQSKPKSSNLSWISSLFRLRKRKKKSAHGGPVETNFFPPEAWNDDFPRPSVPDRDRLWRSRSVSSGRVIKKSFTPLEHQEENHHHHHNAGFGPGFEPAPGRFSVSGFEHGVRKGAGLEPGIGRFSVSGSGLEPGAGRFSTGTGIEPGTGSRVSSLIALDMRDATSKVMGNGTYEVARDVAGPRASVASLMDIDRRCAGADVAASSSPSPGGTSFLQRSKSTGGWRRKIRSESPSSVLMPNPTAAGPGGEWSFYLTPLRTFSRNRSSRHAR